MNTKNLKIEDVCREKNDYEVSYEYDGKWHCTTLSNLIKKFHKNKLNKYGKK